MRLIREIKKIYLVVAILFSLFFGFSIYAMTNITDLISTSNPSKLASHEITFKVSKSVPPGGRIEIIPEASFFTLESEFDYTDVDFAIADNASGPFVEREVSEFQNVASDRASAVLTTGQAKVFIDLNTIMGVPSNYYVRVKLGGIAQYGDVGDKNMLNPGQIASRMINIVTYDAGGNKIENGNTQVAIVNPVKTTSYVQRKMMDGSPSGWLNFGTTQTIMALMTNYRGFCRYSMASGTPYEEMTGNFTYMGGEQSYYHTVLLNSLGAGGAYTFYVRCDDGGDNGDSVHECHYNIASSTFDILTGSTTNIFYSEVNECVDYEITFNVIAVSGGSGDLSGTGTGGTGTGGGNGDGIGSGSGPGSGGSGSGTSGSGGGTSGGAGASSGGGGGGGGGGAPGGGGSGGGTGRGQGNENGPGRGNYLPYPPLPGAPGVILAGYGYSNADINVLKDGQVAGLMKSDSRGIFKGFVADLTQGTYSFGLWSNDSVGNKSVTYSSTFFIQEGTQTTVSGIILAPTIAINNQSSILLNVYGETAPLADVEAWLYPKKSDPVRSEEIVKSKASADTAGRWSANFDTSKLKSGQYYVKAKSAVANVGASGFSKILEYNLNVTAEPKPTGACPGGDLNHDGKVNIIDFSILLYNWNTNNACADQNNSGNVDLIDFSIMMFYWTG